MSPFAQGAHDAGAAAGRAVFADLKRQWGSVVAELDMLIEARAVLRGVGNRLLADAQAAAIDGLVEEFDRLFAEWAGHSDQVAMATRSASEMVAAE